MWLSGRILTFHVVMESPSFSNTLLKNVCVCVCVCVVFIADTLEWG